MGILRYLTNTPGRKLLYSDHGHTRVAVFFDRRSITRYGVSFRENLVSWKNKKQGMVSRFSAESKYMTMTNMTLELI